jgi:addiction module HigA family antidote
MHNPLHPGEFIYDVYLEPAGVSCRYLAKQLDVSSSTLHRVIKGQSAISLEMALRLSKAIGRTPESCLSMQDNYDLWHAKQKINLTNVHLVNFAVV